MHVPGAARREQREAMRRRPGTVTNSETGTAPDQQRTTRSARVALHPGHACPVTLIALSSRTLSLPGFRYHRRRILADEEFGSRPDDLAGQVRDDVGGIIAHFQA